MEMRQREHKHRFRMKRGAQNVAQRPSDHASGHGHWRVALPRYQTTAVSLLLSLFKYRSNPDITSLSLAGPSLGASCNHNFHQSTCIPYLSREYARNVMASC